MDTQQVKEYLELARQAGKQETSDLVDHILHKMEGAIQLAVDKSVNGKIIGLTQKLEDYIVADNTWKAKYEPYLLGMQSLTIGGKIIMWIIVSIGTIAGAVISIKTLIK